MSSWTPRTVYNGIEYGGNHQQYWWDENLNPGATFTTYLGTYDYALPNCTTYCWGRILEAGDQIPVTYLANANNWHNNLTNGWTAISFNINDCEPGDILEWAYPDNHVAVVEAITNGQIYVSQSFYTDDNGTAYGNRTPAVWGSTKAAVSAYGLANYPYRFFNYRLDTVAYGYHPTYILKNPAHHGSGDQLPVWMLPRKKRKMKVVII